MMTKTQTIEFAQWVLRQTNNLQELYSDFQKDTDDQQRTDFFDFCVFMFKESKFYNKKEQTPENLIQIRVVVKNGSVEKVYSDVSGKSFDVDIYNLDDNSDDEFLAKVNASVAEAEHTLKPIY